MSSKTYVTINLTRDQLERLYDVSGGRVAEWVKERAMNDLDRMERKLNALARATGWDVGGCTCYHDEFCDVCDGLGYVCSPLCVQCEQPMTDDEAHGCVCVVCVRENDRKAKDHEYDV